MVRKISVSDQAYQLLNRLREELGTATHSETILVLADRARLCSDIEPRLRKIELLLVRLLEEFTAERREGPETRLPGGMSPGGMASKCTAEPQGGSGESGASATAAGDPQGAGREPREDIG